MKEKVKILTDKVNTLKRNLEDAEAEKAKVEADANASQNKFNLAEKLVKGLAGENKRSKENVIELQ